MSAFNPFPFLCEMIVLGLCLYLLGLQIAQHLTDAKAWIAEHARGFIAASHGIHLPSLPHSAPGHARDAVLDALFDEVVDALDEQPFVPSHLARPLNTIYHYGASGHAPVSPLPAPAAALVTPQPTAGAAK